MKLVSSLLDARISYPSFCGASSIRVSTGRNGSGAARHQYPLPGDLNNWPDHKAPLSAFGKDKMQHGVRLCAITGTWCALEICYKPLIYTQKVTSAGALGERIRSHSFAFRKIANEV